MVNINLGRKITLIACNQKRDPFISRGNLKVRDSKYVKNAGKVYAMQSNQQKC